MNNSPARIDPEETAIGRPTPTARRLVEASVSPNTRRAYAGALRRLDAWLDGRELDDAALGRLSRRAARRGPLPTIGFAGLTSRTPAASLRSVLGERGRLPATRPARRVELSRFLEAGRPTARRELPGLCPGR